MKEHNASPEMQKFFGNLLEIKQFVKEKYDQTNNDVLLEIYERLHKVIKTTDEQ